MTHSYDLFPIISAIKLICNGGVIQGFLIERLAKLPLISDILLALLFLLSMLWEKLSKSWEYS